MAERKFISNDEWNQIQSSMKIVKDRKIKRASDKILCIKDADEEKPELPKGQAFDFALTRERGHLAVAYGEDIAKFIKQLDQEFLADRKPTIKDKVYVDDRDKTLIGGFPTEWLAEEDIQDILIQDGYELETLVDHAEPFEEDKINEDVTISEDWCDFIDY